MKKESIPNPEMLWGIYPKIISKVKIPKKKDKVLDVGCGIGKLKIYLPLNHLGGIDFNKNVLIQAKENGYIKTNYLDLNKKSPFKDNSYDAVIYIEKFHYVNKCKELFLELKRVAKNQVIISIPNFNCITLRSIFQNIRDFPINLNKNQTFTNRETLVRLDNKVDIKYISCRGGIFRNVFGNIFLSEVIGVFEAKD